MGLKLPDTGLGLKEIVSNTFILSCRVFGKSGAQLGLSDKLAVVLVGESRLSSEHLRPT